MSRLELSVSRYQRAISDMSIITLDNLARLSEEVRIVSDVVANSETIFELNRLARGFLIFTGRLTFQDGDPVREQYAPINAELEAFFNDAFYLAQVEAEIAATRNVVDLANPMFEQDVVRLRLRIERVKNLSAVIFLSHPNQEHLLELVQEVSALFEERKSQFFVG